jgi:hypothetical protein
VQVIFAREFCLQHILECWFGVRHTPFFDFVGCTLQNCVFVSNTLQHMKRLLCPFKVGPTCQLSPSHAIFLCCFRWPATRAPVPMRRRRPRRRAPCADAEARSTPALRSHCAEGSRCRGHTAAALGVAGSSAILPERGAPRSQETGVAGTR